MAKKQEKGKLFKRIMAGLLVGMMVLSVCVPFIYAIMA